MSLVVENRLHPRAVASAFGRVFYGVSNRVYFSQVFVDDQESLGRAYQRNDPTSQELNDILDNDGGEILLQNSGDIRAMRDFAQGILIFADRGIWYLAGGEAGFTATAYTLRKVSNFPIYSDRGIIDVGGTLYFASTNGLFTVRFNEYGQIEVTNISEESIDSFWTSFASSCLMAVYDEDKKQVQWIQTRGTKWLIHDLRLNAFYPQEWGTELEKSLFAYTGRNRKVKYIFGYDFVNGGGQLRSGTTFAELKDDTFKDLGQDYTSYLVTNYETLENFTRYKGIPIMSAFFNRTENEVSIVNGDEYEYDKPSSCYLSIIWDWASNNSYGKITEPKQIYNPLPRRRGFIKTQEAAEPLDTGEQVIQFKDKIRGRGQSVQFKFESEEGKDLQLLGYSVSFSSKGRQ